MKQLLIIDQKSESRDSLLAIFTNQYSVSIANNSKEALHHLSTQKINAVLLDVISPIKNCLTLLKEIQKHNPTLPIILISATTSVKPVINSIQNGAYDFITKPFIEEDILCTIRQAIKREVVRQSSNHIRHELSKQYPIQNMVGKSPSFISVMNKAKMVARSESSILIYGERGTGKELTARFIHNSSERKDAAFITTHGSLWPISRMHHERFGSLKKESKLNEKTMLGLLELAESGTIFFNEVTKLSFSVQEKLSGLLLKEKHQQKVLNSRKHTAARILVSSPKNLMHEVKHKHFLKELFQSNHLTTIHLPSLRERREDIPLLCNYFMTYYCEAIHAEPKTFNPDTFELLCRYSWPGNISELRNIMERIIVLYPNRTDIQPECLPKEFHHNRSLVADSRSYPKLADAMNAYEHQLILKALRDSNGVQTKAAKLLGTTRRIFRYRMEKFKIS